MNCKVCSSTQVVDSTNQLCRKCHTQSKVDGWLDNTDIENLGIVKWCRELMPEYTPNATPWFHKELLHDLLSLYNTQYTNKYERLYELICFREGAKSTVANMLFISYIVANNGRRFKITIDGKVREFLIDERTIVIISQTAGSAEDFTVRIRDNFSGNERLRYYYAVEIQAAVDDETGQWTRSAFKINNCFVQGIGSGQMIRGKVKGASRPTLVIADDIYSEKTIITEESRAKTRAWWNNAVINSVDNLKGKIVVLGTILHDDTVLVDIKKNPRWRTKEVPLMNVELFNEFVNEHTTVDWDKGECSLPFDNIENLNERFLKQKEYFGTLQKQRDWKLAWPQRIDLYLIATKYQEHVHNNTVSGMYQEYFHITRSPRDKKFRKDFFTHFKKWDLEFKDGHNWLSIDEGPYEIANVTFGVDLSGTGPDDDVITIMATTANGKIFILQQSLGKWSLRDDLEGDTSSDLRYGKVCLDRGAITKIGIIDEMFRLAVRFNPYKINIGASASEEEVIRLARKVFQANYNYTLIVSRKQTATEGDKFTRIYNTLSPYYETRMVYHGPNLQKLEYQLEYLGASDHDDCADSLECSFYGITYPSSFETVHKEIDTKYPHLFNIEEDWWLSA